MKAFKRSLPFTVLDEARNTGGWCSRKGGPGARTKIDRDEQAERPRVRGDGSVASAGNFRFARACPAN